MPLSSSAFPASPTADAVSGRFDLVHKSLAMARQRWADGAFDEARRLSLAVARERLSNPVTHVTEPCSDFMEQAEGLLGRRLVLLGYPAVQLGESVDWLAMSDRDDQWTQHLGYFKWTCSLAQAWNVTRRLEFAVAWADYVADFLANAPYGRVGWPLDQAAPRVVIGRRVSDNGEGTHWNSLAAATRSHALLDGLALVLDSGVVSDELLLAIIDHNWNDAFRCMVNNPRSNTPNQYMHTSLALLLLGLSMPEHAVASAAYEIGLTRLRDAVARQTFPDGSDLEQSTNYNYSLLHMVDQLHGVLPKDALEPFVIAARQRLRFLCAMHYPDGFPVEIAKNGRGADDRQRLTTWAASLETAPWLRAPGISFPWGGWYVLSSSWRERGSYMLLKACAPGMGHTHEDSLSLVLWCGGRRLLVDSGNFSYGSRTDLDVRMNAYGFSGAAHNVVLVDGHGARRIAVQQALRGEVFEEPRLRADSAGPMPNRALAGHTFALVEGTYNDGFGPNAIRVQHHRQVLQVEGRGWLVIDRLRPDDEAEHEYARLWQLAPEAVNSVRINGDGHVQAPGFQIIAVTPAKTSLLEGSDEPVAGWYFPAYGQRQAKPDLRLTWSGCGAQIALTWLGDDTVPVVSTTCQRDGSLMRSGIQFSDGSFLALALAINGNADLAIDSCSAYGEMLAILGQEAAALTQAGATQFQRRLGEWESLPWPPLPEARCARI
ncbi:MAG: alginate lyase family protein [Planctomycetes bacterium]|nr:alginate lyase family protein [Planctomycetota bacterium]